VWLAGPAGTTAGDAPPAVRGPVALLDRSDDALRAVQFVLDAPGVRAVALVGGFNDWDPTATRLEQVPGTTVWTTTVLLPPGRYTYAFIVDDSTWVLDPRAPRAEDPDYGVQTSVLLVGWE
jgi:1,4-alpha-glucan branching enzyme